MERKQGRDVEKTVTKRENQRKQTKTAKTDKKKQKIKERTSEK